MEVIKAFYILMIGPDAFSNHFSRYFTINVFRSCDFMICMSKLTINTVEIIVLCARLLIASNPRNISSFLERVGPQIVPNFIIAPFFVEERALLKVRDNILQISQQNFQDTSP